TERGPLGGDREVTGDDQLVPTTRGRTVDRRDHRPRTGADRVEQASRRGEQATQLRRVRVAELGEGTSGAEAATGAGDHHGVGLGGVLDRGDHGPRHVQVVGVAPFRRVDRYPYDVATLGYLDAAHSAPHANLLMLFIINITWRLRHQAMVRHGTRWRF